MNDSVLYSVVDGIATITLNRPQVMNAINAAMMVQLRAACERAERDESARAVVLRGAGPAFLAGGDVAFFHANLPRMPALVREGGAELHHAILALRRAPKPVLASVHGAVAGAGVSLMAAADLALRFDPEALDAFARLAAGQVSPHEPWGEPTERIRGGAAEGVLAGGCLSVITALLGTPYEPDFRGALLFLEDVEEPAYRLDRMLTQWVQSGRLSKIAGILVGTMAPARGESEEGIRRVFHDAGKRLSVPVRYGFPAGHAGKNVALPFGVRARFDERGRLFLLDSPVGEA